MSGEGHSLDAPRAIHRDPNQPRASCRYSLTLPPLILLLNESVSGDISKLLLAKGDLKHISGIPPEPNEEYESASALSFRWGKQSGTGFSVFRFS